MEVMSDAQREAFSRTLTDACAIMEISLTEAQIARLLDYLGLFIKWNKTYNLSAIRDPKEMLSKHLLDSLAVVAHFTRHPKVQAGYRCGYRGRFTRYSPGDLLSRT